MTLKFILFRKKGIHKVLKYRPQVLEAPASTNKSAYLNLLDAEKSFADLEIGLADDRRPSGGRGHRNVQLKKIFRTRKMGSEKLEVFSK